MLIGRMRFLLFGMGMSFVMFIGSRGHTVGIVVIEIFIIEHVEFVKILSAVSVFFVREALFVFQVIVGTGSSGANNCGSGE